MPHEYCHEWVLNSCKVLNFRVRKFQDRMADVFLKADVRSIFKDRKVLFMGDSVLRNLYQDFVYLVEKGTLTPNKLLKKKGKQIEDGEFPGDTLVEGGDMVPGRDYQEV